MGFEIRTVVDHLGKHRIAHSQASPQIDEFPGHQHSFQMTVGLAPEADDAISRFAAWARPKLGVAVPA